MEAPARRRILHLHCLLRYSSVIHRFPMICRFVSYCRVEQLGLPRHLEAQGVLLVQVVLGLRLRLRRPPIHVLAELAGFAEVWPGGLSRWLPL